MYLEEEVMEVIARLHGVDKDIVEIFDDEQKWLIATCHIDSLAELGDPLANELYLGEEVLLRLEVA